MKKINRNNNITKFKFRKLLIIPIYIFSILFAISFSLLISSKISDFNENIYTHKNSILQVPQSMGFAVLFMMVLLFIIVSCFVIWLRKSPIKTLKIPLIISLVLSVFSFYGLANSYQDYCDNGIYVKSIFSSEHFYSFSDIKKIETHCYTGTDKGHRYYGMKYNIVLKNGKTLDPINNLKMDDYPKLYEEHKIIVDQNKVAYYSTGVNDPVLSTYNDYHDNEEIWQAINNIFTDKNQITVKANPNDYY